MADTTVAAGYCNQYVQSLCDTEERCQISTVDECLAEAPSRIDCTRAVGATLSLEQCLSEMAGLACTASSAPDACEGVIKAM